MSKNFNIQETVHRNIEKNQFPSFTNHRSLIGWCSMNYPKVLQNPIYIQKDTSTETQKYDIDSLFQQKNPVDRTKNEFIKPFSSLADKVDEKGVHTDTKTSCFTLATSKHDNKVHIVLVASCSLKTITSLLSSSRALSLWDACLVPTRTATTKGKFARLVKSTITLPTRENSCVI
jgi:hypothetical protein